MERAEYNNSAQVARLLRRLLDEGVSIEIDGLGTFRPKARGGFEFVAQGRPSVFLAYVDEETENIRKLYSDLQERGFDPWMDKQKLLPGQNWPRSIERSIEVSDFFIACFSRRAVSKRGNFHSELRYALDCAARLPLDDVYIIPVRLDDCRVPDGVSRHLQYVDLFPDWRSGVERVADVMNRAMRKRRQGAAVPRGADGSQPDNDRKKQL